MLHKYFCGLLFCTVVCGIGHAQSLKLWTWDTYKMKFRIPDNLTVKESTADKFEATNYYIALDIYPKRNNDLTYSGMKKAIIDWSQKTGLSYNSYNSNGEAQPIYIKDINGYWGCAIDGKKDGAPTSMLLLVDPRYSNICFYIWISYTDEYYHDVVQILKSFEPM